MKQEKSSFVDIHDDDLMVALGMRCPKATIYNINTLTATEKKLLKKARRSAKRPMHFHSIPKKSIPVIAKIIVQLKKNDRFPHTTYSSKCWMHNIGDVLAQYHQYNKKTGKYENLVARYTYNGKVYDPRERPFWF